MNTATLLSSSLFFSFFFVFILLTPTSIEIEDELKCLQGVKNSLADPQGKLTTWTFTNTSAAFICYLVGVTCWNDNETRLVNLELRAMSLAGQFPEPLKYCQSLQGLDLSGNALSGSIPPQICTWLPYLVSLDLSNNNLSGPIPPEIVNCTFLNTLLLSSNKLSGSIPYQLGGLNRLTKFSVADNDLSGWIPSDLSKFGEADFDGNSRLCGQPLGSRCGGLSNKSIRIIIASAVSAAAGSLILSLGLWRWFFSRARKK